MIIENGICASNYICLNDPPNSVLVDDGYPAINPAFIPPDGTDQHKESRVAVEWCFGSNKMDWTMTGTKYKRNQCFIV